MTEIVIGSQLLISGFTYILIQGSNNETVGWRYSFINLEQSELLCVHERAVSYVGTMVPPQCYERSSIHFALKRDDLRATDKHGHTH
jgi:hypothetical protein